MSWETACHVCGKPATDKHHAFFGHKNRQISEDHGFVFFLCRDCHEGMWGVHGMNGHNLDIQLKREAQAKFEETHSREEFMGLIGRNYW